MNHKHLLSIGLLLGVLGTAPGLHAQCNYDHADTNNGWGWDPTTNQSCAPVEGQCEDRGGYPWGWNPVTLESCLLDTTAVPLDPETDRFGTNSAPILPFSQSQSGVLPAGTYAHYYRLELAEAMALQLEGDIGPDLNAAIGIMYKGSHSYSLDLGEPARCFSSGTLIVIVANPTASAQPTSDKPYNISVSATDQQCVEHSAQAVNNEHPDGDWYVAWYVASDGTAFGIPQFWNGIEAYDHNGELLWSTGEIYPTSAPDRLSDGSTAVLSRRSLRLLDTAGEFLWTIDFNEADFAREFTNLVGNDDTIVVYNEDEVASFNSHDGSLRWRYSPQDSVINVTVADNGKVMVLGTEDPYLGIYYLDK